MLSVIGCVSFWKFLSVHNKQERLISRQHLAQQTKHFEPKKDLLDASESIHMMLETQLILLTRLI